MRDLLTGKPIVYNMTSVRARAKCKTETLLEIVMTFRLLIAALVLSATAGCAAVSIVHDTSCQQRWRDYPSSREKILSAVNWKDVFKGVATQLCGQDRTVCEVTGKPPVLVTGFVDMQSGTTQRAGSVLSEMMQASLMTYCCTPVMKGDFDDMFAVSEKGQIVLRPSEERGDSALYPYYEAFVGTYLFTLDRMTLSVQRMNVYTGEVSAAAVREIVFSCISDSIYYSVK